MQKTLMIMTAAALIAGGVSGQTESVEGILAELQNYEAPLATPDAAADMAAEDVPEFGTNIPEFGADSPELDAEKSLDEMAGDAPMKEIDVDALVEQSREHYVAGEFGAAQAGFERAVKVAPENLVARLYLRKLLERDHRRTEVQAMEDLRAGWNADFVLRSYEISADALERLELLGAESSVDVKNRFPEIAFPEGASAVYRPELESIFVRNTRKNLQVLEEIFEAMDVANLETDVDQVEVEAKFVEVSEGTLEQLGFQWNFTDSVDIGSVSLEDGSGLFADALRGSSASPDLPFSVPSSLGDGFSSAADSGWSTFRIEDTFSTQASQLQLSYDGSNPLDIIISALDQSTGADVLSAPRATVRNGEEATLRVGELHWYPEVYEGDADQGTMLYVTYEDFEEKLLGVELTVIPEVDGDQIELELSPKFSELVGWQEYQLAAENTIYNYYRTAIDPWSHPAVIAKLPVFQIRELETVVTIADGSTIGMGGLMNEVVESYEDCVPLLGHLPLVGRLFRSEGERAVKKNLLMFVTAKKVTPSGRIDTSRTFEEGSAGSDGGSGGDDEVDDLFSF
jgi:type II secretory pathway component GspD/PulD (secretin)